MFVVRMVVSMIMIRPGKPHVKCDYCDSKRESSLTQKKSQKIRCSWRHVVFEGVATFQRQKQLARDIESDGITITASLSSISKQSDHIQRFILEMLKKEI